MNIKMPLDAAEREFEECCPCFTNGYACQLLVCEHKPQVYAASNTQAVILPVVAKCVWPGHEAHRRAVQVAEFGAALAIWKSVLSLRESGTPLAGIASIARQRIEEFERRAGEEK